MLIVAFHLDRWAIASHFRRSSLHFFRFRFQLRLAQFIYNSGTDTVPMNIYCGADSIPSKIMKKIKFQRQTLDFWFQNQIWDFLYFLYFLFPLYPPQRFFFSFRSWIRSFHIFIWNLGQKKILRILNLSTEFEHWIWALNLSTEFEHWIQIWELNVKILRFKEVFKKQILTFETFLKKIWPQTGK